MSKRLSQPRISSVRRAALHRRILRWYRAHQRLFDWRATTDPYAILVSEVMLQQTQVSRVQRMFPIFLRRFPDVYTLARASAADVIRAWKGMGYNNRATRLRELARVVCDRYGGILPRDIETLRTLPGIGPYTAGAVACFAFGKRTPVVDVNILRVFSRLSRLTHRVDGLMSENDAWSLAAEMLPRNAYEWNQALMDLGATICTARAPVCTLCPVHDLCRSPTLFRHPVVSRSAPKSVLPAEPSYDGIPQRFWRGRIVDVLRASERPITVLKLGKAVKPDFSRPEIPWLAGVLALLERDRIVALNGRGGMRTTARLEE